MSVRHAVFAGLFLPYWMMLGCGGGNDPTSNAPGDSSSVSVISESARTSALAPPEQPHGSSILPPPDSTLEPFDVQALLARRAAPPESDNAAPFYLEVFEANLYQFLADRDLHDQSRQGVGLKFQAAARSGNTLLPMKVEEALKQLAPLLEKVDLAQSKPACVFVAPIPREFRLSAQNFSHLAIAQLYLARVRQNPDLTTSAIKRTLRLSRDLAGESEVAHLNACGIEGVLYDTHVLLKKNDGTPVRVPLDKLTDADRDWIKNLSK